MSAPLVVNTKDGVCWTRRLVTTDGVALYVPEGIRLCPQFVMATLPELAERGISGTAYALPVPAGPEPQPEPAGSAREDDVSPQVRKLRALLAGQRMQADAARAVHVKHPDSEHCQHDGERWPCPTLDALGTGGASCE